MDPDPQALCDTATPDATSGAAGCADTLASAEAATCAPVDALRPGAPSPAGLGEVRPEHYQRGGEVARGGMGRIVAAQDRRIGRPVALKELLGGGPVAVARFEREAYITGRLQHPAIVPVYEAGRWPTGEPFFAMKLVAGRPLDEVLRTRRDLAARLALLPHGIAVAEALAYAHSRGVIHRDLKPANVLVGDFGETVVIDWGLAREASAADEAVEAGGPATGQTGDLTVAGAVMGTPAYMAPEQAAGQAVDARADVYALGALLYHLVTGRPPYQGRTSAEVLAAVAAGPPTPVEQLAAGAPADLLAVIRKAMSPEPGARYPTADALAQDLRRFQAGQLVAAHTYGLGALVRRWLVRNRAVAGVATAALVLVAALSAVGLRRIVVERDRARTEARRAVVAGKEADRQRDQAREGRRAALAQANRAVLLQARTALERDPSEAVAWLRLLEPTGPGWGAARTVLADARSRGLSRHIVGGLKRPASQLRFSADGRHLAFVESGWIRVHVVDVATGRDASHLPDVPVVDLHVAPSGEAAAFSPAGDRAVRWDLAAGWRAAAADVVVAALADRTPSLRLRVVRGRVLLRRPGAAAQDLGPALAGGEALPVLVDAAGRLAVEPGPAGLRVWNLGTATSRALGPAPAPIAPGSLRLSADGRWLVAWARRSLWLWETATARVREVRFPDDLSVAALAPVGGGLAAVTADGRLWLGTAEGADPVAQPDAVGRAQDLTFGPDGRTLAVAAPAGVALWSVEHPRLRWLRGHALGVVAVAFAPDGLTLASTADDDTVRLWSLQELAVPDRGPRASTLPAVGPDGLELLVGDGTAAWRWSPDQGAPRQVLAGSDAPSAVALGRDPSRYAVALGNGTVWLGSGSGSAPRSPGGHAEVTGLAFLADGRLVSHGRQPHLRTWTAAGARERDFEPSPRPAPSPAGEAGVRCVRLRPWSSLRAAPASPHVLVEDPDPRGCHAEWILWDLGTGKATRLGPAFAAAFSPDGATLAQAGTESRLVLRELASGRTRTLRSPLAPVASLAWSPDARRIAVGGQGQWAWLELGTGVAKVHAGHAGRVVALAFAPEGGRVATVAEDGALRIWDVASGASRVVGLPGRPSRVWWSRDGRRIGVVAGPVLSLRDDLPLDPGALVRHLRALPYRLLGEGGAAAHVGVTTVSPR
jgi:WD40 repeat protein